MNDRLEIASRLEKTMACNCDLDNWQPEPSTGHSWVCRIHKEANRIVAELASRKPVTPAARAET